MCKNLWYYFCRLINIHKYCSFNIDPDPNYCISELATEMIDNSLDCLLSRQSNDTPSLDDILIPSLTPTKERTKKVHLRQRWCRVPGCANKSTMMCRVCTKEHETPYFICSTRFERTFWKTHFSQCHHLQTLTP